MIVVEIDIHPGSDPNAVNLLTGEVVIPVAILGSDSFDMADVDVTTLAFGPAGAVPIHSVGGHFEDVNDDGLTDLVSHYLTLETEIAFGDIQACVTVELLDGTQIDGCDAIVTDPPSCGIGFELVFLLPPMRWVLWSPQTLGPLAPQPNPTRPAPASVGALSFGRPRAAIPGRTAITRRVGRVQGA